MDVTKFKRGESEFLAAADIGNRMVDCVIDGYSEETLEGKDGEKRDKLVIGFKGKAKRLALNVTNVTTLADAYGDDADGWLGKPVTLFTVDTTMGKGVRVRVPEESSKEAEAPF